MAQVSPEKILVRPLPVNSKHDHSPHQKRMARIKGQVEGIERMMIDGRYCPEIIQQIKAARSALKALESAILENHIKGCVRKAFSAKNIDESNLKISELIELMKSQS